ncbi:NAD(P)/FAD-dependent oxidoreductase [Pseudodonghicola flavimaris]|uniref:FAD-dependent oxidoreductase n=1 Tax=Pseudodonghicola flavimaris TaxID=3050036 RepID=A0ABT7F2A3_9RHOB|nr:FAD-dependent oxidoreductase [Pseudodonghicola flavimaris]MDK3018584.1 FAD-dependent oxidoreductase [Pseudodonghicola flavimaris]
MTSADVIVIGGGIAGISAAAALSEEMSVVVLEAEARLGYHATGRSAAIFIRNYGNATLRALNAASAPFFEAPGEIADGPLLSPRGEMLVATEEEMPTLSAYAAGAEGLEHLSPAQAVELVPILRPERICAAVIEWDAQDIDVDLMMAGYGRCLKANGGRIETAAAVRGLRRHGGLWQVDTPRGIYRAPLIVNAAGAWAGEVARLAAACPIRLIPLRRSAALLPAPAGYDVTQWPLFASAAESWYAKPQSGKLMISPADEDPVAPQDAWADDMVLAEGLHRYEQAVTTPVTRVETSWAGLRTFTADRSPVVGFDPGTEGFFWLAGQGGYGVQTAPALARLTAALCTATAPQLAGDVVRALAPQRLLPAA